MFYNSTAGQCSTCKDKDKTTVLANCKRCPELELSLLSQNSLTNTTVN